MADSHRARKATLHIHSVHDHTVGHADHFTPGGLFSVVGSGFGTFPDVPLDVGVYVSCTSANSLIRVHRYVQWAENEIRGHWPEGIDGPLWLFVETQCGDGPVLSAIHPHPLKLRPASGSRGSG